MSDNSDFRDEGEWEQMLREAESTPPFSDEQRERILKRIRAEIDQEGFNPGEVEKPTRNSTGGEDRFMQFLRWIHGRKRGWAIGVLVVAVVVGLVVGTGLWDNGSGAYAAAVNQLRLARTMTWKSTSTSPLEGDLPQEMMEWDHAFKEPGYFRWRGGEGDVEVIQISDFTERKSITLLPKTKQYQEIDLSGVTSEKFQEDVIGELRSLPSRADKELGRSMIDGRQAEGFRLTVEGLMVETIWLDAETGDILRIECESLKVPGVVVTMTDFEFDVTLDDSLFSLSPPDGYTSLKPTIKASIPGEEDLLKCLAWLAEHNTEGLFPPTFDPVGIKEFCEKAEREGIVIKSGLSPEESAKQAAEVLTPGMMFPHFMKPENDFHYQGANGKLGEADKPICWWRPDGSETYRVIYADLSVRNVSPEDLPPAR